MTWNRAITDFLFHLQLPFALPEGVGVLNVHRDTAIQAACRAFYNKFYADEELRYLLIGINPGRFGGGITGIPFTDPIRLQEDCGIHNPFPKKQELSSVFIYEMINAFGGPALFFRQFYLSAVSPLGFIQQGKNLNYYDHATLKKAIEPFVADCLEKQLAWGLRQDACFCIGEGQNLQYLQQLNQRYRWFDTIYPLPHPRFVMQYKLKQKATYLHHYLTTLQSVL